MTNLRRIFGALRSAAAKEPNMRCQSHSKISPVTCALLILFMLAAPAPDEFAQSKTVAPDQPAQSAEAFFKPGVARYQQGALAEADFERSLTLRDHVKSQLEPALERVKADKP